MLELFIALLVTINIEFSWNVAANANGYQVGIANAPSGPYTFTDVGAGAIPMVGPILNRKAYLWSNFDDFQERYVVVRGYNDIYVGDSSEPYTVGEPGTPGNVKAAKK